jgi:hypothetical protein
VALMARHTTPADEPHDVLAAEAFAVPASDPSLRHGRVVLPDDPTGIEEPHDVLAAEEFAMPALVGLSARAGALTRSAGWSWQLALWAAAGGLVAFVLARVLRRG